MWMLIPTFLYSDFEDHKGVLVSVVLMIHFIHHLGQLKQNAYLFLWHLNEICFNGLLNLLRVNNCSILRNSDLNLDLTDPKLNPIHSKSQSVILHQNWVLKRIHSHSLSKYKQPALKMSVQYLYISSCYLKETIFLYWVTVTLTWLTQNAIPSKFYK